ncbi:MAG: hypothetical protein JJ863_36650 [Deltaproteobacteria bacterium]|nr:hypothetical protein [Deltaproteobacteria bacterium]
MSNDHTLQQALADIGEWYEDHGAQAILDNLAPAASAERIEAAEAAAGHPFPADLAALYRWHDGQQDPNADLFFPHGGFAPLELGQEEWSYGLRSLSFPEASFLPEKFVSSWRATPGAPLDPTHVVTRDADLFREDERVLFWHCVATMENSWLMVHLVSGRVFAFLRKDAIYLAAESLTGYVATFADDLWNDRYLLAGDATLPEVKEGVHAYRRRFPLLIDGE